MTLRRMIPRVGFLAALLLGSGSAAAAEVVRIGGSGAATEMLPHLFAAFEPDETIKLEVIPSLGSTGGLRALSEGVLDIAVTGRALKPEELAQGLTPKVAIRTPFMLVTSHPRPNGFKSSEIAGIFNAARATWADGSPIRIILRPRSDSDTAVLGGMFPGMAAAIERARQRADLTVAATDQDNADVAERVSGSLTGATLVQIKLEKRNLRFVAIDGVEPSLANLGNRSYPFAKTQYFVLPAKPKPAAERFVGFLRSPEGQAALRAADNILIGN